MGRNDVAGWFSATRWVPVALPVAVLGAMLALNPTLRVPATWDGMARNWTGEALLAVALTPIIVTGGIDLSVGSVVGLSAVVAGFLWRDAGLPIAVALAGSLATGLACGVLNGGLGHQPSRRHARDPGGLSRTCVRGERPTVGERVPA